MENKILEFNSFRAIARTLVNCLHFALYFNFILCFNLIIGSEWIGLSNIYSTIFYSLLYLNCSFSIVFTMAINNSIWNSFLSSKLLVFVSTISYSLYIWHNEIYKLLKENVGIYLSEGSMFNILLASSALSLTIIVQLYHIIGLNYPF